MNAKAENTNEPRGILSVLKRLVMCRPKPQKEQHVDEEKEHWSSELIVYFTNEDVRSFKYTGDDTGVKPWRRFYKWWFSRKDSSSFIFRYQGGETMIRRDLIKSFQLVRNDT